MKLSAFIAIILLFFELNTNAQNFILNSKFDDYTTYLDSNKNTVYQPKDWYYNLNNRNHPIYYSSERFLNKSLEYNFHPDAEFVLQGQKLNYISVLLLPNPQKAYTILKTPLRKGHSYHLQFDIKTLVHSN